MLQRAARDVMPVGNRAADLCFHLFPSNLAVVSDSICGKLLTSADCHEFGMANAVGNATPLVCSRFCLQEFFSEVWSHQDFIWRNFLFIPFSVSLGNRNSCCSVWKYWPTRNHYTIQCLSLHDIHLSSMSCVCQGMNGYEPSPNMLYNLSFSCYAYCPNDEVDALLWVYISTCHCTCHEFALNQRISRCYPMCSRLNTPLDVLHGIWGQSMK